jgi:hypothetical protein
MPDTVTIDVADFAACLAYVHTLAARLDIVQRVAFAAAKGQPFPAIDFQALDDAVARQQQAQRIADELRAGAPAAELIRRMGAAVGAASTLRERMRSTTTVIPPNGAR